ncbi:TetR/AcrR family transcriptional regulator [Jeongeupia chitinilytica]|uniref:TetR family transcriptional regulator n=1 Tax=Jeongeupia chitinilytica TaxID=1041641 RepID=A0ABQ3H0J3_9NEIS|nr:TetR/AcrR family transcriptional regulator [Jeongeupia chitinilytica]GHD61493.1 TetR family transcriptional regulator [Jeongeupia chitinilytica]
MAERGRPRCFDRELALRRAMAIFWKHGYEGSSLACLTDAMQINSPSLYATFGSKEALFKEALDLYDREAGSPVAEILQNTPSAREAVAGLLQASARCFCEPDRPAGCMVLLSALNCTPANAGVWQHLHERRLRSDALLRARLVRGVADGDIPATADVQMLATFYIGIRQGMSMQALDGAGYDVLLGMAGAAMAAWDVLVSGAPPQPVPTPASGTG